MKKSLLFSLFALLFSAFSLSAQTVTCGSNFSDPGGPNANYSDGANVTTTICPTNPGDAVTVTFSSFDIEANFDFLKVYDGTSATAPLLATYSGTTIPSAITASNTSGCLTFVFTSDSVVNKAGWVAMVSCGVYVPITCPKPIAITATAVTSSGATINWTETGTATQWEVLALPAGTVPSSTSVGTIATTQPFQMSGMNLGSTYNVYVRALCSPTDISAWSTATTVIAQLCAAPTQVIASNITQTSATVSWVNTTNATSWQIATQLSSVTTTPTSGTVCNSNANYPLTGLLSGTAYKVYVKADCGDGTFSAWSVVYTFTTLAPSLTTPVCGDVFADNGGLSLNYYNYTNSAVTIYPSNPGEVVTVTFNSFDVETTFDGLYVYNGNSTSASQISSTNAAGSIPGGLPGAFWGTVNPGPFTSTSPDGSLTFKFISDYTVNKTGWSANVTCGPAPSCPTPMYASAATNITQTGATFNWTETGSATQWEVLVQPATSAAPTASATGIIANANTFSATGLNNATAYKAYVRAVCSATDASLWSNVSAFTTAACSVPLGLSATWITGTSATLTWTMGSATQWEVLIQPSGNTAPTATTAGITTSTNSYNTTGLTCGTTYNLYVRSICSTTQTSAWSSAYSFTTTANQVALTNLNQCDDDMNGTVIFDLTSVQSQINTTLPLQYYVSLTNATAQINPIANPTTYAISSSSTAVTIFVKTANSGPCETIYTFQLHAYSDCNLAHICNQANSLCGSLGIPYTNTHNGINAETGNNYGCLYSTPNPTWFYLPISNAGVLNLTIEQNDAIGFNGLGRDVDYIVYGPFSNPTTPCSTGLNTINTVSCSYSAAPIEHPVIPNAQVGQYYLLMVTNFSNQPGFIRITVDPASTASIDCSGLRLNAFLDTNSNGTQDTTEQNFPLGQFHYEINSNGNPHNITSPTGIYNIYDLNATNSYNLSYTLDPAYSAMYGVTTSSYPNVNVVIGGGMVTYNFPISTLQSYSDVGVAVVPYTAPRAGATYKNIVVYANLGNQPIASGTITYTCDAGTTIATVSQTGTTSIPNGFTYDFTNLLPFETRAIVVNLNVPTIPTVAIGDLLTNTVTITPPTGDLVVTNNAGASTQAIVAAYDPNDKVEAHGEKIRFASFSSDEYLYYTIRFENTGNISAINVRVNDVLDSKIDETSVKMVNASHAYTLDRIGTNLSWKFENIQLPVSIADTDTGKGYITFKAKLKPGFAIGDIIPNFASIYFDTNPAIITNTFNTEFVTLLGTASFNTEDISIYPNPSNDVVQITIQNTTENIESINMYDVLGKLVKKASTVSKKQTAIDVSDLAKGVYVVEIITENKLKQVKKLVVK